MAEVFAKSIESKRIAAATAAAAKEAKPPSAEELKMFNLAQTFQDPTSRVLLAMDKSYRLMGGQKDILDRFSKNYTYYDGLVELARAMESAKARGKPNEVKPPKKEDKENLNTYFTYQKKALGQMGYGKVAAIDKLTVFEAQKALEWALAGANQEDIVAAITKSRQGK
jgi:hypothetical protein